MNTEPRWLELRRHRATPAQLLAAFGVDQPPVQVEDLARWLGIRLVATPNAAWAGQLEFDEEPPVATIRYRANDARVRRRYTIAHELGHLMRGHTEPGQVANRSLNKLTDTVFTSHSPIEVEANRYAAQLLMPRDWALAFNRHLGTDIPSLATIFDVSEQAMTFRLANIRMLGHQ